MKRADLPAPYRPGPAVLQGHAGGAFSTVDVAGARATLLTRIKNGGAVMGVYNDVHNEMHGLTSQ
jgi:hypothetical protein